jgi:hypothetical protein
VASCVSVIWLPATQQCPKLRVARYHPVVMPVALFFVRSA